MKKIHEYLSKNVSWYEKWHRHPKHAVVNWTVLIVIAVIFTGVVYLASDTNPLFSFAGFRSRTNNTEDISRNQNGNLVSILGDGGMVDPGAHVMLYLPNTTQRHADCITPAANGTGPNGNLITVADNNRTDWPDSELSLANKCFSLIPGSSSLGWYHWGIALGNGGNANQRVSANHQWSERTASNTYITGFSGEWQAPEGQPKSRYKTTISTQRMGGQMRRVWESSLTSGTVDYDAFIMFPPSASEYRQILFDRWMEGSDITFQAWVKLNESVPSTSVNRYRFAAPEIEGCWKVDGSACSDGSTSNVTRFLSFDLNPQRVDLCRADSLNYCPSYHMSDNGERIPKTDTQRFPYDAYYFWCGAHNDPLVRVESRCGAYGSSGQEIVQLAPHSTWARFGAPAQPLALGRETFLRINIGAVADRFYKAQAIYPNTLRYNSIYVGPEMFSQNVTVNWKVSAFDVLKPGVATPPPTQSDVTAPQITNIVTRANLVQASISWATNESADSKVEYRVAGSEAPFASKTDAKLLTQHIIALSGLFPNTTYSYQITSRDAAGNSTTSEPSTFTTSRITPR